MGLNQFILANMRFFHFRINIVTLFNQLWTINMTVCQFFFYFDINSNLINYRPNIFFDYI